MTLSPGSKLGCYEILVPLGAGAMGEVYRARDIRLDRTIAIKVLPEHLCLSSEARQRFDREARPISALSHPNICRLYGVGQQDGIRFLVMEYLEGEALADRLRKGPIPIDQIFRIAEEICKGLEQAHRTAPIHRGLKKPSNVMLTRNGAKLMDFGLAKTPGAAVVGRSSSSESLATMFPDAANGSGDYCWHLPVHVARASRGKTDRCKKRHILIRCCPVRDVTGKRAFDGKTTASTGAAVLAAEPKNNKKGIEPADQGRRGRKKDFPDGEGSCRS